MKKTAEIFLNMLYPKKCPMCHQILKQKNSLICSGCAGKIRPNVEPLCKKCGRPVKTEEEYCQDCRREQHYFSEGRSIFFIRRDVAAVSGTVQILRVSGIRRFLRKSHEYLWKEISGTLEPAAYRSCSAPPQKEKKQRI